MSSTENLLPLDLNGFHIHFVGIKGTGMAALVEIAFSRGAVITGSDVPEQFYTDEILKELHIPVKTEFSPENITDDIQLVIHSSAYKREVNPDLLEADRRHIPVMLYTEALGAVSAASYSCGIAGVHGKTTTTGLAGTILKKLQFPAQVLAGSVISSFNGRCTLNNGSGYFVAETCEYQRHFMSFHPQKIILTSVESDHEDYFPTYEDIRAAFIDYIHLLPPHGQVIYCADDKGATETVHLACESRPDIELIPYGEKAEGSYALQFGRIEDGKQYFSLAGFDGDFVIKVPGRHMVRNACAAAALACELLKTAQKKDAVSAEEVQRIKDGIADFCGAKRRSEIVGNFHGCVVMDDYGHHPTAIKTTLEGLRLFYPNRRIVVDFMSHTYTRTAALIDDFAAAFSSADEVILHKIYPSARESYDGTVTGKVLFEKTKKNHKNVVYFEEVLDAEPYVRNLLKNDDLFITMGAGDNWKLGRALLDAEN